uniref:Uncharacterized protein n=1 Tax=Nelumbo nucifera TaxID=4432 RepID=A0A822XR11_NELNU|nr:TPA_asm: hypothetical protein HUJ06_022658 [Nelumbo nucifera]
MHLRSSCFLLEKILILFDCGEHKTFFLLYLFFVFSPLRENIVVHGTSDSFEHHTLVSIACSSFFSFLIPFILIFISLELMNLLLVLISA